MNLADLQEALQAYARPDRRKAILQILDTLLPYLALYALMVVLVREGFSYWPVLGVAVPTAAFYVRVFILFHDCCHGSFFGSRKANRILGYVSGILTFTPFEQWRRSHAKHHETVGDLDRRGVGDIWTLTVEEYRAASRGKRVLYRIVRNPFAILFLGPPIVFLIGQRYFHEGDRTPERWSVVITDVAIAAIVVAASVTIGLETYLMVQLPITMIAAGAGLWLFYVQHQFEGVYWARHDEWDRNRAAMEGSSFYRLPAILRWFTGSIGFHHVHHVQQRIPNYALERCHRSTPALQTVTPMTLLGSFRCARLHLWDEAKRELTGYHALKS
jgi:omega-6 fatty acid desaturase (delta-12 desaturase)